MSGATSTYNDSAGQIPVLRQGVALHQGLREHGDLVAGHVHRRQPGRGHPVEVAARRDAQGRCGDVNTHSHGTVGRKMTEKASSISVVAASSMLNAGASPAGRSGGGSGACMAGKPVPLGKWVQQEGLQVEFVARRNRPAFVQQTHRRQARCWRRHPSAPCIPGCSCPACGPARRPWRATGSGSSHRRPVGRPTRHAAGLRAPCAPARPWRRRAPRPARPCSGPCPFCKNRSARHADSAKSPRTRAASASCRNSRPPDRRNRIHPRRRLPRGSPGIVPHRPASGLLPSSASAPARDNASAHGPP
jgi:hypothetical protein